MIHRLWNDEVGAIVSAELVLVLTILVIGMIVGLTAVRDSVVSELADVAQAIANVNQSYSYGGITGHCATTAGSIFLDARDFCDGPTETVQRSKCVNVCTPAAPEGVGIIDDEE